jgi:hypothetical protein
MKIVGKNKIFILSFPAKRNLKQAPLSKMTLFYYSVPFRQNLHTR